MTRMKGSGGRGYLPWGIGLGVFLGFVMAFMIQALAPVLAKLPGLLICGGDELELVVRRRRSHGVCVGDVQRQVGYGTILIVSTLVWSVLCTPVGIAFARWMASKAARGRG